MYTELKPEGYIPRITDQLVERKLNNFGGVEISGTKWCGKSWTSAAFSRSISRIDDDVELYETDPSLALLGDQPHAIDEWQDVPAVWNRVRHSIDDRAGRPGQFILTGSSTPPEDETRHSGAGRIGRVRMRTMTLSETGESNRKVSLAALFEGRFEHCESHLSLQDIARILCRGGWPILQGGFTLDHRDIISDYLDLFFDVSVPKSGKNSQLARRLAASLARNLGTSASLNTIAQDVASGDTAPTTKTIRNYIDLFLSNYIIEELPGWDAPIKSKSRLRTKPKLYYDDPSIAAALLSVNEERLLHEGQLLGQLFESLCVHDLLVYASLLPESQSMPLRYYSDADGLEVDVIIELRDGRWAAIEIKLGEPKVEMAAANLKRLQSKIAANPAARNPEPEFLAVVIGAGKYARQRKEDGVYIIPIGTLTA